MKLYHATKREKQEYIEWQGTPELMPGNQEDLHYTNADETFQGSNLCGIFGFTALQDAKDFGYENGGDFVVYEFDADGELLDDPEYSDPDFLQGEAKFFVTESRIGAVKVFDSQDDLEDCE